MQSAHNTIDYEPIRNTIRLMNYNWQLPNWPQFDFDTDSVEAELLQFADLAGQVSGAVKALPDGQQTQALIDLMIAEAIKTSEIEGEFLSRHDVTSSIRNGLGLNTPIEPIKDQASAGAAQLMLTVRDSWNAALSQETLFEWHRTLLMGNQSAIQIGAWRSSEAPMQVISGQYGRVKVHFEAPPSSSLPIETKQFFAWFNQSRDQIRHAPVRAAIAHLYFESMHPFDDGNGRIGRAIAEKALSQGLGRPALLSLSRTIEADRTAYYAALESAQHSAEVTPWVTYFTRLVLNAQKEAETQVNFTLQKTKFFDRYKASLSERQSRVIQRMLEAGPTGFEGGMNARKYGALTKVSKATATRDLQALAKTGALIPCGGGRSVRYELNL
jgi:Fic family protein